MKQLSTTAFLLVVASCSHPPVVAQRSHPPMRPLPVASSRPMSSGPARFVDVNRGRDSNDGSLDRPWKSIRHATMSLSPGDALYLRGGVYHEHVRLELRGTREQPITIRSYPDELAVIDGGIARFVDAPQECWEPVTGGAPDEYRSKEEFSQLPLKTDATNLLGNFGDSMVPLHGYRFLTDLRSDNHQFRELQGVKTSQGSGLYCGPGIFLHPETKRIHIRLAATDQPSLGEGNNYRGETDPRKLPLIISGGGRSALELAGAQYVNLQDLVVRGAREATINLVGCCNITLDGVTSYGGSSALRVERTSGLRCVNSVFRGIAAPWLWRWSLKYRSIEARIVSASSWNPPARGNRDFEFAYCEFTDCVDGVFIGNVEDVTVRNCLLDNVSDDGFFITCRTAYDGTTPGGNFRFHHNRISRVLTAFAFGVGHGRQRTVDAAGNKQLGAPAVMRNNVLDLREPVLYQQPTDGPITTFGRVAGDHGSPAWEPIEFSQNTVYMRDSPWRNYYAAGWAKAMGKGTRRKITDNLFVHQRGLPGQVLPSKAVDLEARGNVHWSEQIGAGGAADFLQRFGKSELFQQTRWTKGDQYLSPQSAPGTCGAGANLPIGCGGRLMLYGQTNEQRGVVDTTMKPMAHAPRQVSGKRVVLVLGYPAFDAPMLQFALEKAGHEVSVMDRQLLKSSDFERFDCVAFLGSTTRAKMEPSGYGQQDCNAIRGFLQRGGSIMIGRELTRQLFPGDDGRKFVESMTGGAERIRGPLPISVLVPDHPWISHLRSGHEVRASGISPIMVTRGENLIGNQQASRSVLAKVPVGQGRLIYVGWNLSSYLPPGRKPSTVQQEEAYLQQYRIYEKMIADVL